MLARTWRIASLAMLALLVAACTDDGGQRRAAPATATLTATATPEPSPSGRDASATPATATPSPAATPVTATPSPSPNPTTTAIPTATPAGERSLTLARAAADLSQDMALIVQTGCFQCDGPATGLVRLYRDAAGTLRSDELIRRPEGGLNQPYISSLVVAEGGSEMAVTICARGYCGALAAVTPDAETTVLRSRDGGITWVELERRAGVYGVVAATGDGVIIAGPFIPGRAPALRRLPGGQAVTPPAGAEQSRPIPAGGALLWQTFDGRRLLRADGTTLFETPAGPGYLTALPRLDGERIAVTWWDGRESHLTVLDRQGRRLATWNAGEGYFSPGAWLDAGRLLGNAGVPASWPPARVSGFFAGQLPAVMDVTGGELAPITDPFLKPPFLNGRNHIEAVMRGPFLRVTTSGDCLHVRETPDAGAPSLACVADRVLLRDLQEEREAAGVTWRRVEVADGRAGWASAAYLER